MPSRRAGSHPDLQVELGFEPEARVAFDRIDNRFENLNHLLFGFAGVMVATLAPSAVLSRDLDPARRPSKFSSGT
jgi:hypothetical protein